MKDNDIIGYLGFQVEMETNVNGDINIYIGKLSRGSQSTFSILNKAGRVISKNLRAEITKITKI